MSQVTFNDSFFESLGTSPEITALCQAKADAVAATARATAPVRTGAYKRGIVIQVVRRRYRNAVLVVATDKKSLLIESKRGNLARALRAAKNA